MGPSEERRSTVPPQAADGHEAIPDKNNMPVAGEPSLVRYARLAKRADAEGDPKRATQLRDEGLKLWLQGK